MNKTPLLPDTLALRVQFLREKCGLSITGLANKALIDLDELRDIEQGITLFLAPHWRLQLAKALKVRPQTLQDVEKLTTDNDEPTDAGGLSATEQLHFMQTLLNSAAIDAAPCPRCDDIVQVQRFERLDPHGQVVHALKVRCPKCWLKLDHG